MKKYLSEPRFELGISHITTRPEAFTEIKANILQGF